MFEKYRKKLLIPLLIIFIMLATIPGVYINKRSLTPVAKPTAMLFMKRSPVRKFALSVR